MASDYTPEVGLVVSGGNFDGGRGDNTRSSYRSKDGAVTFEKLPDLPIRPEAGCVVIVSEDEIFRLGGKYNHL